MELTQKDILIKQMVRDRFSPEDKLVTESDISKVINHQYDGIIKAFVNNNSVEVSGFGKFMFRLSSAEKYLNRYQKELAFFTEKLNDPNVTDIQRRNIQISLSTINANLKLLKPKIDKAHGDK